jgi:AmiR/NasT family two-component response regulator
MSCSNIWIAPHLRVLIADTDHDYCALLRMKLGKLGFRTIDRTTRPRDTLNRMSDVAYDLVMVEITPAYKPVWDELEEFGAGPTLVVGMSLDRSGNDWIDAIRQGADAILMKAFDTHLLQPVLAHMLASPAARRCRLVQFPRPEPVESRQIRPGRRLDHTDSRDR